MAYQPDKYGLLSLIGGADFGTGAPVIAPKGGWTAASAAASPGSPASGGGSQFAPGQSARYTPDPTVNGPWTHTRADIPLFRSVGSTPAAGGTGAPTTHIARPPGSWQQHGQFPGRHGHAGGHDMGSPEMTAWRAQRPAMPASYQSVYDTWKAQRPDNRAGMQAWRTQKPAMSADYQTLFDAWKAKKPDRRTLVANALEGN